MSHPLLHPVGRPSTVVRVSATMLRDLIEFCRYHCCGVILRNGGVEYGYTAAELSDMLAHVSGGRFYTRKNWHNRYLGFPTRTHYVHDAYDCHDAMDDLLEYARSIGGVELVEAVTSDPLYQLL